MQICFPTAQAPAKSDADGARQPLVYPERVRIILAQWGRTINLHAHSFFFFFVASLVIITSSVRHLSNPLTWIFNPCALFSFKKQREGIVNAINTFYNLRQMD